MNIPRANVVNAHICAVTFERAIKQIEDYIEQRGNHYICFSNVHTVITCRKDAEFRRVTNEADLALPDGMPLVWALKLLGYGQHGRVYGPDVLLALCLQSKEKGYSHFFYGGNEGVPELLVTKLTKRFPWLKVAGYYSPPFRPLTVQEDDDVIDMINNSGADILWVGLGAPKQELWMADHQKRITVPVMLGVGAAFDFHSGKVKQAPRCLQNTGLEWLFRLCMEPRRLWRRYLYNNPLFIFLFSRQLMTEFWRRESN